MVGGAASTNVKYKKGNLDADLEVGYVFPIDDSWKVGISGKFGHDFGLRESRHGGELWLKGKYLDIGVGAEKRGDEDYQPMALIGVTFEF